MTHSEPLVSIGLPVYNGGDLISLALDSLLAQDYENFELIISDNASTDGTSEVCQAYAARDRRISYHRNAENLGAVKNTSKVFELSKGKYFMLGSHDDLWEPGYVKLCVTALENDASLVLCCSSIRFIDEAGRIIDAQYDKYDNPDLSSPDVRQRARVFLSRWGWYAMYGLMRADALRKTGLGSRVAYGGDVLVLMELCLQGPFAKIPEVLFWYRQFEGKTEEDRAKLVHPDAKPDYAGLVRNLIRMVRKSSLSPIIKLLIIKDIISIVYDPVSPWKHRMPGSRVAKAVSFLKRSYRLSKQGFLIITRLAVVLSFLKRGSA